MKFDRNILEKLVETNAEAYKLLHYQYTALDSRYASLENEYRETVRRIQESNLVPLDTFNEVKDAYSQAALLLSQAQQEMENLQSANASAQKAQQEAEYNARYWQAKYEDIQFRIKPAPSLYKSLIGQSFEMDAINSDNTPSY